MTTPPAAVTDTHSLFYHSRRDARLGSRARVHFDDCERGQAMTYVPVAVVWETALLVRSRQIRLRTPVREFFEVLFSNPAFQPVDIDVAQTLDATELLLFDDPFDALICAAARHLSLPLMTRDERIVESKVVSILW